MFDLDTVWINRIGILLNFTAGFLMAPDLIGRAYLAKLEHALKRILIRLRRRIRQIVTAFELRNKFYRVEVRRRAFIWVAAGAFVLSSMAWVAWFRIHAQLALPLWRVAGHTAIMFVVVLTVSTVAIKLALSPQKWQETAVGMEVAVFMFYFGSVALILLFGVAFAIGVLFLYALPRTILRLAGLAMHKLRGNERLLKVLLVIGITCFVAGNMLQLWATKR